MRALPGPGGRHLKFAIFKGNRFVKANPLVSKAVPTAIGFAFGDFLTQYMHRDKSLPFKLQIQKTVQMAFVGALIAGPIGLFAIQSLSQNIPLAAAVLSAEVFGCLIWQISYITICPKYRSGALQVASNVKQKLSDASESKI
eukprot:gene17045-23338_t